MKIDKATDDGKLLTLISKGNEDAFNEIYRRYSKLIYYVAFRTCKNDADAQDIMQETLLTIKNHAKDIRNPKFFRLWIYRIISSKCNNMFKKNQRTINSFDDEFYENNIIEQRSYFLPRENVRKQNDQEVMNEMITRLPSGQSLVVMMFYMEQFSIPEISEMLKIPEGTVKSRLSTARKSLQEMVCQYKEVSQEPITFRSLSQLLPATLWAGYDGTKVPVIAGILTTSPMNANSLLHRATTFISSHAVGTTLVCVALTSVAGYGAYQKIQSNKMKAELPTANVANYQEPQAITDFKPIAINDEMIDTPKKAFYTLQLHACCDKDIEEMRIEQLLLIKDLYEEMKLHGGRYYEHLVEIGWAKAYEEKILK